jgi:flap endonuclease-1
MGVDLSDLVFGEKKLVLDFSGQTAAVDAYNTLYQFLAIIRQPDGSPLMDSRKRVTSHLSGILYRNLNLMEAGINPIYVFDGPPHRLKAGTIEERSEIKARAQVAYAAAIEAGDLELARSKAQQTSRLTKEMVGEAKTLLKLMGIPWVQAPADGEAEAANLVLKGQAAFVSSQDFDSLLFGASVLVRNLTITGKRKLPRKQIYINLGPERMELEGSLKSLGITREQLVGMCILMGTDFNEGIHGIGPKKALKLILENGSIEKVIDVKGYDIPEWKEVRRIFLEPDVADSGPPAPTEPDVKGIVDFLVGEHDFSRERVESPLKRLMEMLDEKKRSGAQLRLDKWF